MRAARREGPLLLSTNLMRLRPSRHPSRKWIAIVPLRVGWPG